MSLQQLGEILKKASEYLKDKGVLEPRLSAEWLLASLLKLKRMDLYTHFDRPLTEDELTQFRKYILRRVKHEPISYILENQPFYGLDLYVNHDVLIPRPETEELVSVVIKNICKDKPLRILDLCTGSGAIACVLKKQLPQCEIHASDISIKALDIAKKNAQTHNLDIIFHESDLLTNIEHKFDVIVSNPPYINSRVVPMLDKQVKDYEPHLALDGGIDGLRIYQSLQQSLNQNLNEESQVFLEIGFDQKDQVVELFSQMPYKNAICLQDSNMNHRFVMFEYTTKKESLCLGI